MFNQEKLKDNIVKKEEMLSKKKEDLEMRLNQGDEKKKHFE